MDDAPKRIDDDPEHIAGDPKRIVGAGYDRCALAYAAARKRAPSPELVRLIEQLPRDARVLDIGCGAGIPVMASLARVARVVGVDISRAQVALALENVVHADLERIQNVGRPHRASPDRPRASGVTIESIGAGSDSVSPCPHRRSATCSARPSSHARPSR